MGTGGGEAKLAEHAVKESVRSRVDLLELRTRHHGKSSLSVSTRKITVLLHLPASVEELWEEGFSSKLRSQIRRSTKDGMEARFGSEHRDAFYEVFSRHMRDLGTPVLPRGFFDRLAEVFKSSVEFGVVYKGQEPVAGGCGFIWRSEFEMTWASSLLKYKRFAPNMLLYSAFIRRMLARGLGTFNFGRCTPGTGTHRFKLQWGGTDVALPWLQWSPRGVVATPSPERRFYRFAANSWRHLPLPVANRLGPVLARRLP